MAQTVVISGTGLYTPEQKISNEELVESFNTYVAQYNQEHADAIAAGSLQPLQPSSAEFIEKASGIRSRYVLDREGILDPKRMRPRLPTRGNDEPSFMCDMGAAASREALQQAGVGVEAVDGIIVACSNMQRPYPAIAVELQAALGVEGWGYDMNVACASAAFGIQAAADAVRNGSARAVLVVSPEICSGHLNFCDRDSHFIFGDAATAVLVTVHPQMLDVMSMCQFLLMTSELLGVVAEAGGDMSYDWMRYVITRYEPGDGPQNQMVSFMRSMFGEHVLNHTALKSTAISDAGMTKQTLYEVEKSQFVRSTYERALESMNAVNGEIAGLIQTAWGR